MKRNLKATLLFLLLAVIAVAVLAFAVRFAYLRYEADVGEGSFSGLASLPLPALILLLSAPLLAILLATGLTFRAIRRARRKEEEERKRNGEDGEEEYPDF